MTDFVRDANGQVVDAKPTPKKPAKVKAIRPDVEMPHGDWRDRLIYKRREIVSCQANAITVLKNDPAWAGILAWDEFSQGIITLSEAPWDVDDRPSVIDPTWQENDATRLASWLARHYNIQISGKQAYGAAVIVAESKRVNPPLDWISALKWDGVFRVDKWLSMYLGVDDSPYSRIVGRYFVISAVARLYKPGCKADCMLVLEGEQGEKKSSACKVLFSEALFSDTPIELESKDRFLALRGRWGLEFAELDSLRKVHSSRTKSFISSPTDDYRPPYAAASIRVKRRCVLIGSVNPVDDGYFADPTGNRRYWPVRCSVLGPILLDALSRDRDQLWAEAKEIFLSDPKWWPETKEEKALCNDEQEKRLVLDPWLGTIERYLAKQQPMMEISIREILEYGVGMEIQKHDRTAQSRVGSVLSLLKWTYSGRSKSSAGERERKYMRRADLEQRAKQEALQKAADEEKAARVAEFGGDPDAGF